MSFLLVLLASLQLDWAAMTGRLLGPATVCYINMRHSLSVLPKDLNTGISTLVFDLSGIPFSSNSRWQSSVITPIHTFPLADIICARTSIRPASTFKKGQLINDKSFKRQLLPSGYILFCVRYSMPRNIFFHMYFY